MFVSEQLFLVLIDFSFSVIVPENIPTYSKSGHPECVLDLLML